MKAIIRIAIDLEPGDEKLSDAFGTHAVLNAFAKAANMPTGEATEIWREAKREAQQRQLPFKETTSPRRTRRASEAKGKP
jgi:hypothetical protein